MVFNFFLINFKCFFAAFIRDVLNVNEISLQKYQAEKLFVIASNSCHPCKNYGGKTLTESLLNFVINHSEARKKNFKFHAWSLEPSLRTLACRIVCQNVFFWAFPVKSTDFLGF